MKQGRLIVFIMIVAITAIFVYFNRIIEGLLFLSWAYTILINRRVQRLEEEKTVVSSSNTLPPRAYPTNHNYKFKSYGSTTEETLSRRLIKRAGRLDSYNVWRVG